MTTADARREAFATKAEESLASATSEFANGRYNSCMNRCYYSCFQAAVAALIQAGITPRDPASSWGHAFVQAQLSGVLINRRHLYPPSSRCVAAGLLGCCWEIVHCA